MSERVCHHHPLTANKSKGTGKAQIYTLTIRTWVERHACRASGHYLRPVLKSLPGVHSHPGQEERWEAETSKVNTRVVWTSDAQLPFRRKMNDPFQKGRYWSSNNEIGALRSTRAFIGPVFRPNVVLKKCCPDMAARRCGQPRLYKHHHALNKSRERRREDVW